MTAIPADPKAETNALADGARSPILRGTVAATAFFGLFLGWAAFTPMDAAVVAQGAVAVAGNRQAVQHIDGGMVRSLKVKEGDHVEAGMVLLELDDTELRSQEGAMNARLIDLEAQRARLLAEFNHTPIVRPERWSTFDPKALAAAEAVLTRQGSELGVRQQSASARNSVLVQQLQQLEARLPGYARQKTALDAQITNLDTELKGLRELLAKGLTTIGRVNELERSRAGIEGQIGRIDADTAETREKITEVRSEIVSLTSGLSSDRAKDLREAESQIAELIPRHAAVSAQLERTALRAPAAGEVVGLTAFTVGGVIEPRSRVMDIVPSDREFVVEASAPPDAGDDLHVGSPAEVRLTGLGHRNLPTLKGVITKVSADKLVDQHTGAGYFRIEVKVPAEELAKAASAGDNIASQIRPGIPADVVVPTRTRTALQYLVEPLGQSLWKSFRE